MEPPDEVGETHVLAAMLGMAEMVAGLTDTEEILEALVRIAPGLVRVDRCALMVYDESTREFHVTAAFGPSGRPTRYEGMVLREVDLPRLAQRVVEQRLPVVVKDARRDPMLPTPVVHRLDLRSALIAPIACRGRFLGLLWLDHTAGQHYFTSREINIVQGVATWAGIALDAGRLQDAATWERRRFEALASTLGDGSIAVTAEPEPRIVRIDAKAERILGWPEQDVRGRRIAEVLDLSSGEAGVQWHKEASGLAPATKELRLRTRDGRRIPFDVVTVVVRREDGGIAQFVYVLRRKDGPEGPADGGTEASDQFAAGTSLGTSRE